MQHITELLDIDPTPFVEPTGADLTELEGNTPVDNRPTNNPFSIVEAGEESYWVLPEPPSDY